MYTICIHCYFSLILQTLKPLVMNKILLSISFILIGFAAGAQQKLIDSLQRYSYQPDIKPETCVKSLADLGYLMRFTDRKQALLIGNEAIKISWGVKDKQYASYAWMRIYNTYRAIDSVTMILTSIDSAMYYAKQSQNPVALGNAYRIEGNYAYAKNNVEKAVLDLLKALDYLRNEKGQDEPIGLVCYMLSSIFVTQKDLTDAKKYIDVLMAYSSKDNFDAMSYANFSYSSYYYYRFRQTDNMADLDSAIYFSGKTCDIFRQHEDVLQVRFAAGNAALNLASYLWVKNPDTPQDTIFKYTGMAVEWASKIRDMAVIANAYGLMSEYLCQDGQHQKAERTLLMSLKMLEDFDAFPSVKINIGAALLRWAERYGGKDDIMKYHNLYLNLYKATYDAKQAATIKELDANFNQEKKELEINALQKKNEFNRKVIIGTLIFCLVVMVFAFLLSRSIKKSKKQHKLLLASLAKEAEAEKKLTEERSLRSELEHRLTLQQNEQLQKEVLAGAVQLQQKNELLENLRKEIQSSGQKPDLDRIIKDNLDGDDYFEDFKSLVKDIHPDFFKRLQAKANKPLTDLDLKYCVYIYMNISSKQMASMLHVEYNTIRMNKSRLKKKFNLPEADNLEHFIKGIAAE